MNDLAEVSYEVFVEVVFEEVHENICRLSTDPRAGEA